MSSLGLPAASRQVLVLPVAFSKGPCLDAGNRPQGIRKTFFSDAVNPGLSNPALHISIDSSQTNGSRHSNELTIFVRSRFCCGAG